MNPNPNVKVTESICRDCGQAIFRINDGKWDHLLGDLTRLVTHLPLPKLYAVPRKYDKELEP